MAFGSWVTVRDEVIKKEIYGIVRLYRLTEKGALESDSKRFLDITFPTTKLCDLLTSIVRKLIGQEQRGTFVVTGGGGSGKSHLLVACAHLLQNTAEARQWLRANNIEGVDRISPETLVLPYQLVAQGGAITKLWEPLFRALGKVELLPQISRWPEVWQIKEAIDGRAVVVLLDEWEDWYQSLTNQERQWNRNFIQNLSEVADEKDSRVVLIVSSLERDDSIRFVLTRPNTAVYDLNQDEDREEVVLYRLFKDRRPNEEAIKQFWQIYINNQETFDSAIGGLRSYQELMRSRYPLHPELLKVAFEAYGRHRHYQNTRGVLAFLADVVMEHKDDRELLLPCDVNPYNRETQHDLNRLEPALLSKFLEDLERAKGVTYSQEILMPIFLWSLTEARGIEDSRILLGAAKPGVAINELQTALVHCYDKCWHLRKRDGRYLFEPRRKIRVVVDERARRNLQHSSLRDEAKRKLAELVKGEVLSRPAKGVSHQIAEDFEEVLVYPVDTIPDTARLKLVVSLLNLDDQDIREMLQGIEKANTVAVLLPITGQDLTSEGDFLLRSRRLLECDDLEREVDEEERKELNEVRAEELQELIKALRAAYGRYMKPLPSMRGETHMPQPVTLAKDTIIELLKKEHPPLDVRQAIRQQVQERADRGIEVGVLLGNFLKYRHLPMLLSRATFEEMIRELTLEGQIVIEDGVTVIGKESPEVIRRLVLSDRMRLKDAKYRGVSPELIQPEREEVPAPGQRAVHEAPPESSSPKLATTRREFLALQAAVPASLRSEANINLEEKAKVVGFSIDIRAEALEGIEKLNELLQSLKARGIKAQISFSLAAQDVFLTKSAIIDLINKLPIPISETQLPPDTVTLRLEVEVEGD